MRRLWEVGFYENQVIAVELPGQCDCQVCNARLGVAMQLAESIMVEPFLLGSGGVNVSTKGVNYENDKAF